MSEKQKYSDELNDRFRKWRKINTWIDRVLLSILLFLTVFIGSGLIDGFIFLEEGISGIEYHSFEELRRINPDTADITKKAGANVLVSGSCLFSSEDMAATANLIKEVPEC